MTPPIDFSQVSSWLLMPATLLLLANIVITNWFSASDQQRKNIVKFIVFILVGLLSYALTLLPPDVVAKIQPLWLVLATVIAAYYAPAAVNALKLLGIRMLIGRQQFHADYGHKLSGGHA